MALRINRAVGYRGVKTGGDRESRAGRCKFSWNIGTREMSWLNRRIIVILLRVHSNFTRNHSPFCRGSIILRCEERKRADDWMLAIRVLCTVWSRGEGFIKKEKEKKMKENGGNTMKQNLFCVESCSQGLWVELSRFPSETNSTVLVSFFSSPLPFYN